LIYEFPTHANEIYINNSEDRLTLALANSGGGIYIVQDTIIKERMLLLDGIFYATNNLD